jgi:hypothetical protein
MTHMKSDIEAERETDAANLVAELEVALVEYVEKFGPTERAHRALRLSSLWHSRLASDFIKQNAT